MSSVPVSMDQLEVIVESVSRELLEQWAIDDRFTEDEMLKAAQNSVNDTVFVINKFMEYFNETMISEAHQSKLI
jgi:hypothetical protein